MERPFGQLILILLLCIALKESFSSFLGSSGYAMLSLPFVLAICVGVDVLLTATTARLNKVPRVARPTDAERV
jgi:hypothetical protein